MDALANVRYLTRPYRELTGVGTKHLLFVLIALSLSLATAQVDPRARTLLDGLSDAFATQPETLEATDTTLCTTLYEDGQAQPEACVRIVMDFVNRRMYNETRTQVGDELQTFKLIYRDGRAAFTTSLSERAVELPKAQLAAMEKALEDAFDQLTEGTNVLPEDYERATYDGQVRYGEVLTGEKVTVTTTSPVAIPGLAPSGELTLGFIFDAQGRGVGSVVKTPQQGTLLQVFTNPEDPVPYRRYANTTLYTLEGKTPTLLGETKITRYRVNPKLNEALFTLKTQ